MCSSAATRRAIVTRAAPSWTRPSPGRGASTSWSTTPASRFVGLEDGTDAALDDLFEVNVKAPFRLIQAALPHLKASGKGRVVNVASLSGKRLMGLNAGYQMSKHAMVALTHAVRRLGWDDGIRATALCPGYVDTDLTAHVTDLAREAMTSPEDLAKLVATVVHLPNTAAIAELLVNCRYEHML